MRKSTIPSVMTTDLNEAFVLLRGFSWGRVLICNDKENLAIAFKETDNLEHILYEYDDPEEFEEDVKRVVHYPEGGGGDGGVGIPVEAIPGPPALSPGFEEPIPAPD